MLRKKKDVDVEIQYIYINISWRNLCKLLSVDKSDESEWKRFMSNYLYVYCQVVLCLLQGNDAKVKTKFPNGHTYTGKDMLLPSFHSFR